MTHTKGELQQMQSLPLDLKIAMTERRIREFYDYYDGMVSVSFSGGTKTAVSKPMSFWTEQDVLRYIKERDLPIASVYGDIVPESDPRQVTIDNFGCDSGCKLCTTGAKRTGCIFCGFGAHLEKGETRFQRLKRTHPKQYAYCLGGGAYDEDGLWKPDKNGLGMKHVFDVLNEIYGNDFIKY